MCTVTSDWSTKSLEQLGHVRSGHGCAGRRRAVVGFGRRRVGADDLDGVQVHADIESRIVLVVGGIRVVTGSEDRHAVQQQPFLVRAQIVGPGDDVVDSSVPLLDTDPRSVRPPHPSVVGFAAEVAEDHRQRLAQQQRGGQPDVQRMIVHSSTDRIGHLDLVGLGDRPVEQARAPAEQGQRLLLRQRRDRDQLFVDPADGLPACRDDGQTGHRLEEFGDHAAGACEHVLTVVHHQHGVQVVAGGVGVCQSVDEGFPGRAGGEVRVDDRLGDLFLDRGHIGVFGKPREAHPVHRRVSGLLESADGLRGEPGLADTSGPDQRDELRRAEQQRADLVQLGFAADEACGCCWHTSGAFAACHRHNRRA